MAGPENAKILDLASSNRREVNQSLQGLNGSGEAGYFKILNPRGVHALACGLDAPIDVEIDGHTGYYCAGMNQLARVVINGNVGVGVAENMMSGEVWVRGNASQSAGATVCGGLLVIEGNASARCAISLKGGEIVVKGDVGHMSCFMAQAGTVVILGNAEEALGDSIYETRIYLRGSAKSLGADCVQKEMDEEDRAALRRILDRADCRNVDVSGFRRFGSARKLYNFHHDNIDAY